MVRHTGLADATGGITTANSSSSSVFGSVYTDASSESTTYSTETTTKTSSFTSSVSSSASSNASSDSTVYTTETITSTDSTISSAPNSTTSTTPTSASATDVNNASTSALNTTTSTTAVNATTSHISSLWSTLVYPTDCNAYYSTASPSALPGWNATQNSAAFASASDCLSSLNSYALASADWERSNVYVWGSTYTSLEPIGIETETISTTEYRLTTLCDGIPRAVTGVNASSTLTTRTSTVTYLSTAREITYTSTISVSTAPFTTPPPSCSLDCRQCSFLYDAFDYSISSNDAVSAYSQTYNVPYDCPGAPDPFYNPDGSPLCQVEVLSAQMFYWPISTINGDVCNKTGTTVTATPTGDGPNTFVINETITLTSPTVYVSFYDLSYVTVNERLNKSSSYNVNTLMGFSATDIQSQNGYHGSDGNHSFNYADLPPNPVPASAWFGQASCWFNKNDCIPIATAAYAPGLAFPSIFLQMSNFNSQWKGTSCQLGVEGDGIWDPPIACSSESSVAGPSTPAPVAYTTTSSALTSSPAAPSSTAALGPSQTSVPPSSQSSFTAEPVNNPSTSPAKSSSSPAANPPPANTPSSDALNTPVAGSSTPGSSPNAPSPNTPSSASNDVGGIIASVIGLSRTSTSAEGTPQNTQPAAAGPSSSTGAAGIIASIISQGTSTKAAQAPTTQQHPSSADPASAGPNTSASPADPNAPATANSTPARSAVFSVGSSTISAVVASSGRVVVAGSTYTPGQRFTVNGQVGSVGTSAIVVGGTSTIAFSAAPASTNAAVAQTAVVTAGGQTFTAARQGSGTVVVVGSSTLTAGGAAITVSGQVISAASSGLVVGSSTVDFAAVPAVSQAAAQTAVVTAGGQTFTASRQASGSVVVVGSSTLTAGGAAVTVSGQVFSAASSGLVVGSSTVGFAVGPAATQTAVVTAGGQPFTAIRLGASTVVVGQSTLTVGGAAVTVSGELFSAASFGLVVGGTSTAVFAAAPQATAVVTAGGAIYTATALGSGAVIIAGTTLSVGGPAATLSNGQVFSEASSGLVVDGSSTRAFSSGAAAVSSSGSRTAASGGASASAASSSPSSISKSGGMRLGDDIWLGGVWAILLCLMVLWR
ncbi:hypothetical protein LTR35_008330 [Friedmanniomyces endolithicus]|nr:hypothetical protein LTR35_008330 [Friedmanniomyces endolithicus]KAK0296348.1 hypothetical protein LTS00_005181 [Friedmanniomyces endolithicus]